MVLQSADSESLETERALAELCQRYWQPVYTFIRGRGFNVEDAEDLTQDFFARILSGNWLGRADATRGRFRTFLLKSLTNFINDTRDRARSEKRGGKYQFLSIDTALAEASYTAFGAVQPPPEKTFDAQWARSLVDTATQRLREQYSREGKGQIFDVLRIFLTADPAMSYEKAAETLGLPVAAVRTNIYRLRQRFGDALRQEITRTVANAAEAESELRYLCSVL